MTATIPCELLHLGAVGYEEAQRIQEERVRLRQQDRVPDALYLLQHPHVITRGSASRAEHVLLSPERLRASGVELHDCSRGGDVTYHGPGQLVGYPVLRLEGERRDAHRYLRDLEEVLIATLADWGLSAGRSPGHTGVWVGEEKVAAIGVRLARWVTSHGFALNVHPDMQWFSAIVPCGIRDRGVGSMEKLLGRRPPMEQVERSVALHFERIFQRRLVPARLASPAGR